jgi:site-specific DNA-methyltransferase (adenine-specific)
MMYKVEIMDNKLINVKRAAEILGVNPETLRRWDRKGKFKTKRHPINGYRLYNLSDVTTLQAKIQTGDSYDG